MGLIIKRGEGQSFVVNGDLVITITRIKQKVAIVAIDGPFKKYEILRSETVRDESLRQARMAKLQESEDT